MKFAPVVPASLMILSWVYSIFQCYSSAMMKQCLKHHFIQATVVIASEAAMILFWGFSHFKLTDSSISTKIFSSWDGISFDRIRWFSSSFQSFEQRTEKSGNTFVTRKKCHQFQEWNKNYGGPIQTANHTCAVNYNICCCFFLYSFWISDSTDLYTRMRMKNLVFFFVKAFSGSIKEISSRKW